MAHFFVIFRQFLARTVMPHRGFPIVLPADLEVAFEDDGAENGDGDELNLQMQEPLAERRPNLEQMLHRIRQNPTGFRRWVMYNMIVKLGIPLILLIVGVLLLLVLHWVLN